MISFEKSICPYYESVGREFESLQARQLKQGVSRTADSLFFVYSISYSISSYFLQALWYHKQPF